jgi:hypothetical protein
MDAMRYTCRGMAALAAGSLVSALVASPSLAVEPSSNGITENQPAPPTLAQITAAALARPLGSRKVKVKTRDRDPGGLLEVDVAWSGKGPFKGTVFGSLTDLEPDGYCVGAFVWLDGATHLLHRSLACPAGETRPARYSYRKTWRALVQVCLVKPYVGTYFCSRWK